MITLFIAPFFIALQLLVLYRVILYFKTFKFNFIYSIIFLFTVFLFSGVIALILGFILPVEFKLKNLFNQIGFYWLGFILYFFLSLFLCLFIRGIFRLILKEKYNLNYARHITCLFVVFFTIIISLFGVFEAHNIKIKNYDISINKKASISSLNIVMVADLHLGYNFGFNEAKDMVDEINKLNPDLILIAGDIFDNNFSAISEPDKILEEFRKLNSTYGTYAVLGNHDVEEKILVGFTFDSKQNDSSDNNQMLSFLKSANINLLYDDYVEIADIYLYGRPDRKKSSARLNIEDAIKDFDKEKAIIVLDHRPVEQDEVSKAGVDLLLNGHSHNGQMFPANIVVSLMHENSYGLKYFNGMANIVTSGIGLFGPNMRVGTDAEIVNIHLTFDK